MPTDLDDQLVDRVLERIGLAARPAPDLDGLAALYRAWCHHVPFDNLRKLRALRTGTPGPLPGIDPTDFFESYLALGTGGTCWPSNNAMHALVDHLGFDARLHACAMADVGQPNHGTTIVTVDGDDHIVDTAMVARTPIRRCDGHTVDENGYRVTVTDDPAGWLIQFDTFLGPFPCRMLHDIDVAFTHEAYEVSRTISVFNDDVTVTTADPDGTWLFRGRNRRRFDATGIHDDELEPSQQVAFLVDGLGYDAELVRSLIDT